MKIYRKFNPIKREIFKYLTSFLKNSKKLNDLKLIDRQKKIKILITRPNHRLGNQLLLSPLIQEIENIFPNSKIDLLVNGTLSNILFSNYNSVETIYNLPKKPFKNLKAYIKVSARLLSKKYDLAISGCNGSNSSKIFVKLSRSKYKIFTDLLDTTQNEQHIAKIPVYNLRYFLNEKPQLSTSYPKLNIKLSENEIKKANEKMKVIFNNPNPVICVFTYATGNKILPKSWWYKLILEIKNSIPDVNILEILPKENISQLDFEYPHYYSNDLREIASKIENSHLFIGADSGIMHLATSTNTPVIGLFNGTTNSSYYGPYGKNKETINTNNLEIEKIIKIVEKYVSQCLV